MSQTVWFTSDNHFGHANIVHHCDRPFKSHEEMDETMIKNWNERVKPGEHVYHVGDLALYRVPGGEARRKAVDTLVGRLNGQIHLIYGNHDHQETKHCKRLAEVTPYKDIVVAEQKIILCHYAFKTWHGSHRGSWNLHGHSHGSLPRDYNAKQLDVGVDCWNFRPISFEEIREEMKKHVFKPVDHHQERQEEM
jgi:calcineurin-like phosphoesterase family protein